MIHHFHDASPIPAVNVTKSQREKAALFLRKNGDWVEFDEVESLSIIRIGRSPSNDVVMFDPTCSKQHCEIRRIEGRWILRDLNSYNGTFLQGNRITDSISLRTHNRIRTGKQEFLFVVQRNGQGTDGQVFTSSRHQEPACRDTLDLPGDAIVDTLFDRAIAIALKSEGETAGQSQYDQAIFHLFESARSAVSPRFSGLNSLWRAVFLDTAVDVLQAAQQREDRVNLSYRDVVNSGFHDLSIVMNLTDHQIELAIWEALRNKIRSCFSETTQQIVIRKMCGHSLSKISDDLGLSDDYVEHRLVDVSNKWRTE